MVAVPNRPNLDDENYTLGGSGWIDQFGQQTDTTRREAEGLGQTGKSMFGSAEAVQGREGPTTEFGRSQAFGNQQAGAGNWLRDFANGPQGPSAAQAQLQEGANKSMRQSLALARSGSGFGESANGLADAQRANADTMASTANQAAMLRAQEDQAFRQQQIGAMGAAADIYGNTAAREGEQAEFGTNADLQAQQMRDAMQLGLGEQAINATNLGVQGALGAEGMGLDAQRAQLEGRVAQGQTEAQNYSTEADVFATREARDRALHEQRRADRGEAAGIVGSVAGAAASMLSDERSKTNVRRANLQRRYEALRD